MKHLLKIGLAFLFLFPSLTIANNDKRLIKMGYIDVQKTLRGYSEGKKAVDFLKSLKDNYEKRKVEMEEEIKKIEKELEVKARDLTEAQVRDYLTQIESKRQELEIFVRNANTEKDKKEREMLTPIYEKILTVVKEEAEKQGFNFIIDSKYVLVADPELDITDSIIKVLEGK